MTEATSIGAIGRGFRRLREHPGTSFGAAAVLCIPIAFLSTLGALRPGLGMTFIETMLSLVIGVLAAYAATLAAGRYAEGTDPGPGGLLKSTFSKGLGSYFGTRILYGLILFAAIFVAMIPLFIGMVAAGPEVLSIGGSPSPRAVFLFFSTLMLSLALAFGLFVFLYLQLGLGPAANALDRLSPVRSLKRSREVTKGKRGEFFGVLLGLVGIKFALSLVLAGPAAIVSAGATSLDNPPDPFSEEFFRTMFEPEPLNPAQALIVGTSTYLSSVAVTVITAAVLAEFYLALRGPRPRAEELGEPPPESAESLQPPDPLA